ncbi:MAG: type II toxin-antitoxin system VapC family toxin [Myxococcales bacterium]|nr:type II toxin-antitoxin system VapC family toxin [Myxococcales bacterium]
MKLLLDTCTFLWIITDARQLTHRVREAFADPDNEVFLSAVSAWEITVKQDLGKLPLPRAAAAFVPEERARHAIVPLPLSETEALAVSKLPQLHRDPFDRMLICQAVMGGLTLVTPDPLVTQYPIATLW